MKQLFIYSMLLSTLLGLQSCFFNEEDVFELSPNDRQEASESTTYKILTEAQNGWLLEYFPGGEHHDIGGVVLLMSFDGDQVTVMSDTEVKGENDATSVKAGETVTSKFSIQGGQGTILTFATYNTLIHYWSEPRGAYDTDGFEGDFEFIVLEAQADKLVMEGKKNGTRAVFKRLDEEIDWKDYITSCNLVRDESAPYKTLVGYRNQEIFVKSAFSQENVITFSDDHTKRQKVSFAYTDQGIRLYDPVQVNGITCHEFIWDKEERTFVCSDDREVELRYVRPADYVDIDFYTENSWDLSYSYDWGMKDTTEVVTFTRVNESDSLKMNIQCNNMSFNIYALYDATTGMIDFRPQYVTVVMLTLVDGTNMDAYIYLCPWNDAEDIMFTSARSGITSYTEQMSPRIMKFKDNGLTSGYEGNGFVFFAFGGPDWSGDQLGPLNTYNEITLKQRIEDEKDENDETEE